jgi:hypothetical protein
MSSYPNLPGIEVSVNDGGLILPEDGTTESMLVIGACTKTGAPTDPVLVRQSSDAIAYFGNFTDKDSAVNPIVAAWKAAFEGGSRRTYLMALNGEGVDEVAKTKSAFLKLHDALFGRLADFSVDNVILKDLFADKETTALVQGDFVNPEDQENFPNVGGVVKYAYKVSATDVLSYPVSITAPTSDIIINDGADKTLTLTVANYDGTNGKTFDDLIIDINAELATALLTGFKAILEDGKLVILGNKAFTLKSTGTANAVLELPVVDTVAVKGRHEQGAIFVGNFAELLKDYCEDQTINHNTVKGFLGVSAPTTNGLGDIKTQVDTLVALNNGYSGHVSIVAGPELGYSIPGKNGTYYANGVVTYVALVSTLRPESAPTNKAVAGIIGMNYNLSLRQLNVLSGAKYVSFRLKNGQVYVTDGITTAPDIVVGGQVNKSDYTRLSTLRITHAAINLIREIADPFVGEPAGIPQINALNAAIQSGLTAMRGAGAITDFRFTLVQERGAGVIGASKITLQLVPAFETRKISVDVSLRPLI